jgi:hypothetical protein
MRIGKNGVRHRGGGPRPIVAYSTVGDTESLPRGHSQPHVMFLKTMRR